MPHSHNHNHSLETSLAVDNDNSPLDASPLNSRQKIIWLEQAIHPESPNYNIDFFIRIEGKLDGFSTLFTRSAILVETL
ncbi:hypothetical protein [Xenorhabdus hominickii]|uniref:Non-ribosomal peptide synthetase n=1 Tax=Xenorhabdus hominickii TaxID=351679 RepID=A0A2G0Q2Y2_XENHO|nr:hypothetical protein [Xenorhabdus hominickii]AOM39806.1 hypothetical protein A9255_03965 [Xenorhabdus hominickii]PHM53584.1 non-ribosomal peptide synthetase [Xenorhabdus hominickii]